MVETTGFFAIDHEFTWRRVVLRALRGAAACRCASPCWVAEILARRTKEMLAGLTAAGWHRLG
jgi:hypothetical protein